MPQTKEKYQHYLTKSSANQSRKYSRALNNLIKHLNLSLKNSSSNNRDNSRENDDTASNIIGNISRRFSNNLILSVQNLYNEAKNKKLSINNNNNNNNNKNKINPLKTNSEIIDNTFNEVIFLYSLFLTNYNEII
jgi:hypothetical protein